MYQIISQPCNCKAFPFYLPPLATSSIGTPSSVARYPIEEKMAKPAKKEVKQLPRVTTRVSLQINDFCIYLSN